MVEKVCSRCKTALTPSDFHRDKTKIDGLCTVCKSCKKATTVAWGKQNKERKAAHSKTWALKNPKRQAEIKRAHYERNLDAHIAKRKAWAEKNRTYFVAKCAERRGHRFKATPGWADFDEIEAFYADAARLSIETGYPWHVDHAVPLKSKLVCGLHCESNLRVIPASENLSKCNRYWPDMP